MDELPPATERLQLPVPSGGASCGFPGAEPSGCAWALAADAIVYGRLDAIRLAVAPAYDGGDARDAAIDPSTCEYVLDVAVVLEIAVLRSFGREVPARVELHIGPGYHRIHQPGPSYERSQPSIDGDVTNWSVRWPPLAVGQGIGAAIYYIDEYDLWTLLGDQMFGLVTTETGDRVQFPSNPDDWCSAKPPIGFSGLALDELFAVMAACDAQDFQAEIEDLGSDWDRRRDRVPLYGVNCGPASPPTYPEPCTSDADCAGQAPRVTCLVEWGTCYDPNNFHEGPPRCTTDAECNTLGFHGYYCEVQTGICME